MSHVRTISLGQRSRSKPALKVCAFQNRVQPITSSYMVGFKNYLAEIFIMTRQCVACKKMLLGQRSRSQLALKVCAFQTLVRPITSSCMVGLKNYLAEMIITTKQCVACKNHVAGSKVNVTVHTYSLCIGISCSAHNFIWHDGIWKLFDTSDHQDKTMCHVQEPCCYVKGQVHSSHLQFIHRLKWNLLETGSWLCCWACLRDGAI